MDTIIACIEFVKEKYPEDKLQQKVNYIFYNALELNYPLYELVDAMKSCGIDNLSIMEAIYFVEANNSLYCFEDFPYELNY